MEETNLAKTVFLAAIAASKAQRKPEFSDGGVVYNWNLDTKTVTGSFTFPLVEKVDEATGQITHEIADFLQNPNTESNS